MDQEQEQMQFIGFFGIFKESYNIILQWRKIFTQITLSLILPLTIIYLAQNEISHLISSNIERNESNRPYTKPGSSAYNHLNKSISAGWVHYFLFQIAYFTFLLIFSLLSTAAVVYTIASIYTNNSISFKKVISVVPRVWKRLMVTFLCMYLAFFIYNFISATVFILWAIFAAFYGIGMVILVILLILYVSGFIYLSIVWELASVISVLEDLKGFKAMKKSNRLIKGQRILAFGIFFVLDLFMVGTLVMFDSLVVNVSDYNLNLAVWARVLIAILCFFLLLMVLLFGLVIQTVFYLVCKSYRHESIDKVSLADHLESYRGDYERLVSKDVQLQQV